jgi:hypothetical protein
MGTRRRGPNHKCKPAGAIAQLYSCPASLPLAKRPPRVANVLATECPFVPQFRTKSRRSWNGKQVPIPAELGRGEIRSRLLRDQSTDRHHPKDASPGEHMRSLRIEGNPPTEQLPGCIELEAGDFDRRCSQRRLMPEQHGRPLRGRYQAQARGAYGEQTMDDRDAEVWHGQRPFHGQANACAKGGLNDRRSQSGKLCRIVKGSEQKERVCGRSAASAAWPWQRMIDRHRPSMSVGETTTDILPEGSVRCC